MSWLFYVHDIYILTEFWGFGLTSMALEAKMTKNPKVKMLILREIKK